MTDTSGLTSSAPFARWDRDSQSWKTSEATSLWDLILSSLTLPAWGGMRDGELCEHPTPALATSVLDCSSLPTPSANDTTGAEDQAQRKIRGAGGPMLRDAPTLLPTPAVNDMGRGKTPEDWDAWTAKMQAAHGNGNGHGKSLEIEAQRLLPTPRSTDGTDAPANLTPSVQAICDGSAGRTPRLSEMAVGNLLPTPTSQAAKHGELSPVEREGNRPQDRGNLWVVMPRLADRTTLPTPTSRDWKGANQRGDATCLHGETTAPPSPDGSASSDDPHQHQLSLDGLALPA